MCLLIRRVREALSPREHQERVVAFWWNRPAWENRICTPLTACLAGAAKGPISTAAPSSKTKADSLQGRRQLQGQIFSRTVFETGGLGVMAWAMSRSVVTLLTVYQIASCELSLCEAHIAGYPQYPQSGETAGISGRQDILSASQTFASQGP